MQVSVFSIISMAITAVISIGLPVAIFVYLRKKFNAGFVPMLVGVAAFVVFALVLESTIHYFVFQNFALREKPFIYVVYGVLMAGIFEETARFISFNILKKKYDGIKTGLSYGIGHGGIEAILIVGVAMVSNIVLSIMINIGLGETITANLQGEKLDQMNTAFTALATTAPYMFLVGGLERIFAICIQMSLSVIVFYAVYCKGETWLFPCAILLHAIIDIPAAAMQVGLIKSTFLVEGIVCLSAFIAVIIAANVHSKLKGQLAAAVQAESAVLQQK